MKIAEEDTARLKSWKGQYWLYSLRNDTDLVSQSYVRGLLLYLLIY